MLPFMNPNPSESSLGPAGRSRRAFLKNSLLGGLAALAAGGSARADAPPIPKLSAALAGLGATRPRPAGQKSVHDLTTKPIAKVRVAVIGCHRGSTHAHNVARVEFAELVAVCDWRTERADTLADAIVKQTGRPRPAVYGGTEHIWEQIMERDDIDAVYIATPWEWHVPMALRALERGKHACVEVLAAVTVDDCWRLVDASERARRHCVMLENCCYGENEMLVLNLARQGVFGELLHGECAYIHDLRSLLFNLGDEGEWRRAYHRLYNGNLYPTHGLGPVAQYLGIGRGDRFDYLVSLSSPERNLTRWRDQHHPNQGAQAGERYVCGDMNTTLIKTALGRSIMLQHDVVGARPYTRINMLSGTTATFLDYPARLSLDDPGHYGLKGANSEAWLEEEDFKKMREKFTHPLWHDLRERAKGSGHGGMDFVMTYRLMDRIRQGQTPDSTVYDAAALSSILELSTHSVATGSRPFAVPDFSRGAWKETKLTPIAGA